MYLNQLIEKRSGRTLLLFQESTTVEGKNKTWTVERIGYLDEFTDLYENPVEHFKEVARKRTAEQKALRGSGIIKFNPLARHEDSKRRTKNIGYTALSVLYHQLEIDAFLNNRRRYLRFGANLNQIFQAMVYNRVLDPSSKLGAWKARELLFEKGDYSLEQFYRSLEHFLRWREDLIRHLHKQISRHYGRDEYLMYYDVTNYYFESDEVDELRENGMGKENRRKPIVQMGLLMDAEGLPVTYELFKGNTNDCVTFPQILDGAVFDLQVGHKIYVADKGIMSGDNLSRIIMQRDGYVISHSVRKADKKLREWIIDDPQDGPMNERFNCVYDKDGKLRYKTKSRIVPRTIWVTNAVGKSVKHPINERQVVIYSTKYDRKAKAERQELIEATEADIMSLSKEAKNSSYGKLKYTKKVPFNKDTGEITEEGMTYITLSDDEQIEEDERYDGFYIICTNVIGIEEWEKPFTARHRFTKEGFFQLNRPVSDLDIFGMYKNLWKIEETFKVTKSSLRARPVFVWKIEHIRAHFLICFVSLLLFRLLQKRLDWKYSAKQIQTALSDAIGMQIDNYVFFERPDETLIAIGKNLGIDFERQSRSLAEIKKLKGFVKQSS